MREPHCMLPASYDDILRHPHFLPYPHTAVPWMTDQIPWSVYGHFEIGCAVQLHVVVADVEEGLRVVKGVCSRCSRLAI